jgi:hypothetical protein
MVCSTVLASAVVDVRNWHFPEVAPTLIDFRRSA